MGQKAGLSLSTDTKLWPTEKESILKTLCPTRNMTLV